MARIRLRASRESNPANPVPLLSEVGVLCCAAADPGMANGTPKQWPIPHFHSIVQTSSIGDHHQFFPRILLALHAADRPVDAIPRKLITMTSTPADTRPDPPTTAPHVETHLL